MLSAELSFQRILLTVSVEKTFDSFCTRLPVSQPKGNHRRSMKSLQFCGDLRNDTILPPCHGICFKRAAADYWRPFSLCGQSEL